MNSPAGRAVPAVDHDGAAADADVRGVVAARVLLRSHRRNLDGFLDSDPTVAARTADAMFLPTPLLLCFLARYVL